jgi:signal transduction histidine kinase
VRRERLDRWVREHPVAVDGVLALAAFLMLGVPTLVGGSGPLQVVAVLLETAPLAWRRRHPLPVIVVVLGTITVHWSLSGLTASQLTAFLVLYSAAAYAGPAVSRAVLTIALVACPVEALFDDQLLGAVVPRLIMLAVGWTLTLALWVAGSLRGTRRAYLDALVERAQRIEFEREQQDLIAAAAERARIARELHDIVAHSLSVVILQADGGRMAGQQDPAHAAAALDVIGGTARQALTDMRRLLGVLREDEAPERAPQPGLDALPGLVDTVRESGLEVRLAEEGDRRDVSPGMAIAAYRIVQESLTNVMKHAGPGAVADVRIRWEPGDLALEVIDDGRGAGADGGGHGSSDNHGSGLAGMRERAELYGGTLQAGPRLGGGFAVQARLPYQEAAG